MLVIQSIHDGDGIRRTGQYLDEYSRANTGIG